MAEVARKHLHRILDRGEEEKAFTKERQHTAQAFTLQIEWKDGRRAEGFAWGHYSGYRWADNGDQERLALFFGECAIEVEGHNLGVLVEQIREGRLLSIREMPSSKQMLLSHSGEAEEPVISVIRSFPDVEEMLREMKEEGDDKAGHARRIQRL